MGMALFVRLNVCGSIYVYRCRALLVIGCTCIYAYNLAEDEEGINDGSKDSHEDEEHNDKDEKDNTSVESDDCWGIKQIHQSPSRPRPSVRPTVTLINIHEHLI